MEAITIADDEKFLRQVSREVRFPDKQLLAEVEVVKDYLRTHNCFAMASVQLGIPKRIVVIKSTSSDCTPNEEKDWLVLINPEIVNQCGKTEFWEACKSGMTNFGLVERPYSIDLNYFDINAKKHRQTFKGFVCTVISHELDHLEGIFHMDRAKELIQLEESKRIEYRKQHPYKIISTDCHFEYPPLNRNFDIDDSNEIKKS